MSFHIPGMGWSNIRMFYTYLTERLHDIFILFRSNHRLFSCMRFSTWSPEQVGKKKLHLVSFGIDTENG